MFFAVEAPPHLPDWVVAGVVPRHQRVGNPQGVSFWPAGSHAPRESDLYRRFLAAQLQRAPEAFVFLQQVHGSTVLYQDGKPRDDVPLADAHWTDNVGTVLTANVADCCPVILVDTVARSVGLAHSGWRGTAAGVAEVLLREMLKHPRAGGPEQVKGWIGPCAEMERYEVGAELRSRFERWNGAIRLHPRDDGKLLLDVKGVILQQLHEAGLPTGNVVVSPGGTIGNRKYHSHRRDGGAAGRMLAFVTISDRRSLGE